MHREFRRRRHGFSRSHPTGNRRDAPAKTSGVSRGIETKTAEEAACFAISSTLSAVSCTMLRPARERKEHEESEKKCLPCLLVDLERIYLRSQLMVKNGLPFNPLVPSSNLGRPTTRTDSQANLSGLAFLFSCSALPAAGQDRAPPQRLRRPYRWTNRPGRL